MRGDSFRPLPSPRQSRPVGMPDGKGETANRFNIAWDARTKLNRQQACFLYGPGFRK
jgi:hypothetical protein